MVKIESTQPTKRNNARFMLTTATGAAIGAGVRYVMPTQVELKTLKDSADTFFSSAATAARGANRSVLKYAGIGAVVAAGVSMLAGLLKNNPEEKQQANYGDTFEYSKYTAIIDAPEYACEILLYED